MDTLGVLHSPDPGCPDADVVERITQQLAGYDPLTLARWVCALNNWKWPDECPVPRPAGWEDARSFDALIAFEQPLWDILHTMVDEADVSKIWWTEHLYRSEADWQAYWDARQAEQEGG